MHVKFYTKNGDLVFEQIPARFFLLFLYKSFYGKLIYKLLCRRVVSRFFGWFATLKISRFCIAGFVKKQEIDLSLFEAPVNGYQSFNDFFIRKKKPGNYSFDNNIRNLCSPVDGKLLVISSIVSDQSFVIKDNEFSLQKFLRDSSLANAYDGSTMLVFRLTPRDYHRFHLPCDATITSLYYIDGILGSVSPLAYRAKKQPLIENYRMVIELSTQVFGSMLVVAVGAMVVGSLHGAVEVGKFYPKGTELGYFSYGGSTLVLLTKAPIAILPIFLEHSREGFETEVTLGEQLTII
jgi:phosphatidylserine decarboxylase